MMYGNVDKNQAEIVKALRKEGLSVFVASDVGKGFPDLVVGGYHAGLGMSINVLMEVKSGKKQLRKNQQEFHEAWRGPIYTVWSIEDALAIFGIEYK